MIFDNQPQHVYQWPSALRGSNHKPSSELTQPEDIRFNVPASDIYMAEHLFSIVISVILRADGITG
jgi:hypothetical protein